VGSWARQAPSFIKGFQSYIPGSMLPEMVWGGAGSLLERAVSNFWLTSFYTAQNLYKKDTMFEHFLEVVDVDNFARFHNQDDDIIMDAILGSRINSLSTLDDDLWTVFLITSACCIYNFKELLTPLFLAHIYLSVLTLVTVKFIISLYVVVLHCVILLFCYLYIICCVC
jgi:hypothetical protein